MTYAFETADLRDLAPEVIDEYGLPRVMPASFYAGTSVMERGWLGQRFGLYNLPTVELCAWLTEFFGGRDAIEIGSGNGRLAEYLDIPATDSHLQTNPLVRAYYEAMAQPLTTYGPNVERLEALDAVDKYKPQVVVASWMTHRWDESRPERGGNMFGPDTDKILERVEEYVLIGNNGVHGQHPLRALPHDVYYPRWLYSRAVNGEPDFIGVWRGRG